MQVDPEENERPEEDREYGRDEPPDRPEVGEVMMARCDDHSDHDVHDGQ